MIKLRVKAGTSGDPPEITPQVQKDWNGYVDWLEAHGMKGSKELDKKDVSLQWLNKYIAENPKTSLRKEHIQGIQDEMAKLAESTRSFAARQGDPDAQKRMQGTSKVDAIPGSKTTSFKFPPMLENQLLNSRLVSSKNLGLVNSLLQPEVAAQKPLPKGATLVQMKDGQYYQHPDSGDWIQYNNNKP